uniref:Uncharacterized protein n=1 Tax=Manihot esculenta TaxID=3983 RepID=A0A2C9V4J3_MANES
MGLVNKLITINNIHLKKKKIDATVHSNSTATQPSLRPLFNEPT